MLSFWIGCLGELAFNLGDVHLFSGRVHEKIDGVEHGQFQRQLFMLLDIVMGVVFRTITDFLGCPVGPFGQYITNAFPVHDFVQKVVESAFIVFGHIREIRIRQDAVFQEF